MSPLLSPCSLFEERRLLTGQSLRQCCCHCLIAVIKMSTMASGERGPALRCVPVCTHKKFTKGRSIFSRSIENGQSSPRPRLKCQPSYGNGQLGRRVGKQPVGNGQLQGMRGVSWHYAEAGAPWRRWKPKEREWTSDVSRIAPAAVIASSHNLEPSRNWAECSGNLDAKRHEDVQMYSCSIFF